MSEDVINRLKECTKNRGADYVYFVYKVIDENNINLVDDCGQTLALKSLSDYADCDLVIFLLKNGADPNIQDVYGNTLLTYSIQNLINVLDFVKELIENGANPNIEYLNGLNARDIAAENYWTINIAMYLDTLYSSKEDVLSKALVDKLEIIRYRDGYDSDFLRIINRVLNTGDINYKDALGNTLLFWEVSFYDFELIELLLKNGANPNIQNLYQITPLINAVKNQNIKAVRLLLEYGADVSITTFDGKNAFNIAKNLKNKEIEKLLLEYTNNVEIQEKAHIKTQEEIDEVKLKLKNLLK